MSDATNKQTRVTLKFEERVPYGADTQHKPPSPSLSLSLIWLPFSESSPPTWILFAECNKKPHHFSQEIGLDSTFTLFAPIDIFKNTHN